MKELLKRHNVIKEGHFKLTSGRHSHSYINKDAIYCNPKLFRRTYIATGISIEEFDTNILDNIDIITGPAIAGAILALPLADLYGKIFVYPEKVSIWVDSLGNIVEDVEDAIRTSFIMQFRRGYDNVIKNKRVWITEDIITTGGSVEKTIKAIEDCGGEVLGTSVIWNRGDYKPSKGLFLPLINETIYSHLPENCPECADNIKLTDPKE